MTALFFGEYATPMGVVGVLGGPGGIRALGWGLRPSGASQTFDATVHRALDQLGEYFAGSRRDFELPLDLPPLSAKARAVLMALRTVPYGTTITYGELAHRSGTGLPPRAIGGVMKTNPVPLVIPCHRIVASTGLGGFSGGDPGRGLETKRWLLENEGALPPALI